MKNIFIIIAISVVSQLSYSQSTTKIKLSSDNNQSVINYAMSNSLHSWTGESKEINSFILTDEKKNRIDQVEVSVKISSFDSKIARRDAHVLELTEADKFPAINFKSNSIIQENNKLNVTGTLNFHGIDQVISFEAFKNITQDNLEITGNFIVQSSPFNITLPSKFGVTTDENIKISFKAVY